MLQPNTKYDWLIDVISDLEDFAAAEGLGEIEEAFGLVRSVTENVLAVLPPEDVAEGDKFLKLRA
jgi:hypothetical protein